MSALARELEKVAVSVKIQHEPGLLTTHGLAGKFVPEAAIRAENPALAASIGLPTGKDALFIAPKEEFITALHGDAAKGDSAYRNIRRHELTHWLRAKRGKLEGTGKPGLRNVLRTAREEAIAQISGLKAVKDPAHRALLAKGFAPGVVGSVQHAYQPHGGVVSGALGGTLKPVAGLVERLRGLAR